MLVPVYSKVGGGDQRNPFPKPGGMEEIAEVKGLTLDCREIHSVRRNHEGAKLLIF